MKVAFAGPCGRERFGLQVKTSHRIIKLNLDTEEEASKWKKTINDALAQNRGTGAERSSISEAEGEKSFTAVVAYTR